MLHFFKRPAVLLVGSFLLLIGLVHPVLAQGESQITLTNDQQAAYSKLENNSSNLFVNWNHLDNIPNWVRMTNLDIDWRSADDVGRAYQFLEEYKNLYRLSDPKQEFKVINNKTDSLGFTNVNLQQIDHGVPVYAGELQLHFRADGTVLAVSGNYFPNSSGINPKPTLTAQQAQQRAETALHQQLDITDKQFSVLQLQFTEPELYVYNHGIFSKQPEETHLVYVFSVYSNITVLNKLFYIDANDGSIVNVINNFQNDKDIDTLVFADCHDTIGTLTYNETSASDGDTIGSASSDAQAWEVNGYTGLVYDYYFNTFGRDSFDDTDPTDSTDGGANIKSYTHYEVNNDGACEQFENAGWDPTNREMGYGEDYITLDVTGHELTHGVIQYAVGTTDDDTLTYEDETGALNESYADVFGEFIELANGGTGDWLHREDYVDGANRNFANPNMSAYDKTLSYDSETNYGQPSHVLEKAEVTDPICDEEVDNGCLHLNSGITNNALYLLVNGGTNPYSGDGVTTGIGYEAAQQIYYRVLTGNYLTTASDFSNAYDATMQSCLDFHDSDSTTYPLSDCEAVFDAFTAVGINTDSSYAWANITASATSGTAPQTITFDGADSVGINSTISSYAWDFGDGSTDFGGAVSHTFSNAGTYIVTLTVIDSTGYTSDTSITITIYASGTISSDTTWSANRSPYVINQSLTVNSNATLTIEPGTVIKFASISSTLNVAGTLSAQGTPTKPIIFTSINDDTVGGDTNNDGSTTSPAAGDWHYIWVGGSSARTNLDYVTMQYGGYTGTANDYAMFWIDDNTASVSIDHSTLQYSQYNTVQIDPGSTSTISNSTIRNTASKYGISITGGTATLTGNTISSTNSYGLYIYNASPIINGNTIVNSAYGIGITGPSATPTLTDNTFTGNMYPIYITSLNSGTTMTGNTGNGNTYNAILLTGSTNGDFTLDSRNDLVYTFLTFTVPSGKTLTIEPVPLIDFGSISSRINL